MSPPRLVGWWTWRRVWRRAERACAAYDHRWGWLTIGEARIRQCERCRVVDRVVTGVGPPSWVAALGPSSRSLAERAPSDGWPGCLD